MEEELRGNREMVNSQVMKIATDQRSLQIGQDADVGVFAQLIMSPQLQRI